VSINASNGRRSARYTIKHDALTDGFFILQAYSTDVPPPAAMPGGLLYVSPLMPGFSRVLRGKRFAYRREDGSVIKDTGEIERINHLALIAPMGVKLGSEEQLDIPDLFVARPEAVERMTFADPQKARLDYGSMTDEELGRIARDRETHTLLVWEPYMHSAKLRHRLHRLRMPSLFLRGAQDGVVSADYLAGYASLTPQARVETVPAAGHLPQFEQAEATASLIESFLTGAGA
jgi:pimeloyl-ACP methyl ester carboxylesterase